MGIFKDNKFKNQKASPEEWFICNFGEVIGHTLSSDSELVIPNKISGVIVKSIRKEAFMNCGNLKRIKLPNALERIGVNSFQNCRNLEYLYIPKSVKEIGDYAFFGCDNLKLVEYEGSREDWENVKVDRKNWSNEILEEKMKFKR